MNDPALSPVLRDIRVDRPAPGVDPRELVLCAGIIAAFLEQRPPQFNGR